jgi:WD40 repeat protein
MNKIIQILIISNIWIIYNSAFADDSIKTFEGHQNGVTSIAISNNLLVSASKDQTIKVWDINAGTELRTCYGHNKEVTSIRFSPDGNQAISGDLDGTIILWDIDSCQIVHQFYNESEVKSVAWSPNNTYILSGHNNNILKLWDINTKQELRTFTGHTKWVVSAAFSEDGLFVISSSWDNTIRRWNIKTGEHVLHSDQTRILDVNFLLNSNYALSGGEDNTLKVWNLNTTKSLCTLTGHTDTITSVAISKNGKVLISGSSDKTLKQWQACKIPPIVEFSYSIKSMTVTLDASKSNSINDNIIKYDWSTSDGQTSSGVKTSFTFQMPGNYIINLTVTDDYGMSAQQRKNVTVPIAESDFWSQAIIIAGGGAQSSNTLFPYTNEYAQRMYNVLKLNKVNDSDIYYMNPRAPDLDGDGYQEYHLHDYTLRNAKADIKHAFAQASKNLAPIFFLYIHSHARKDHIKITPTYELSASELKSLLDHQLPQAILQIIILDTCYSGSFMDELAGVENRIVMTSTDDKNLAWQVAYNSFSEKFLTQLQRGEPIGRSFKYAEQFIKNHQKIFFGQTPWLDDDGDGYYTDNDGRLSNGLYLYPPCPICDGPPRRNFKLEVHPRIVLKAQQISTTIWIKTKLSHDNIRKVRAILVRPDFVNTEYKGMETDFGREEVELIYNQALDRYEIVYDKFVINGVWNILYQAQDKDGFWSETEIGKIEVNNVPDQFIKLSLNKNSYKQASEQNLTVDVYSKDSIQVKMYFGMVLPNGGSVKTLIYPDDEFGEANQINPYIPKLKVKELKTYYMKPLLPEDAPFGDYIFCGILVPAAEDIEMDGSNWLALDCIGFKVQ